MNGFLFPKDYFTVQPDDMFVDDCRVAENLGAAILYYDQEDLAMGGTIRVRGPQFHAEAAAGEDITSFVYRGWMLSPEEYSRLDASLNAKGFSLTVPVEEYCRSHWFENWFRQFRGLTFNSVVINDPEDEAELVHAMEQLGVAKVFMKDYVKSGSLSGMSIANGKDELITGVREFIEDRGSDFAGKLVVREFVDLDPDVAEIRSWWVKGNLVYMGNHPNFFGKKEVTPDADFLDKVRDRVQQTSDTFITVDFALTSEGNWKVVEVGNGQVSGFSSTMFPEAVTDIFKALMR